MLILAWDTASSALGLALVSFDVDGSHRTLFQYTGQGEASHGQTLAPLVQQTLKERGLRPRDLDLLAVGCGPGSFTGLRVGLALAKGLALGAKLLVVGTSSLAVLATQSAALGLVAPVMDARHRQIFTALYQVKLTSLTRLTEVVAVGPDTLWSFLEPLRSIKPTDSMGSRVTITGSGLGLLSDPPDWVVLGQPDSPSAETLAVMAHQIQQKGILTQYPALPLYGRSPEIFKTWRPPQRLGQGVKQGN
ncbi:MAG: tRNA (adenosine(37)-N6)-threonylcarbamoyltransferase complex dimerization subunit type 1 TsaB [Deltaproteobacteria bacterium]|jgi:tRNA threonylcarbamoyl adenosine modification protein YeaZ|nr:tRNA (adenosine(37)-N6)-threonylcarbamoyltransferase complex dimerization subunit type 1 TsaB [Deltaproteobacteria bacterium]